MDWTRLRLTISGLTVVGLAVAAAPCRAQIPLPVTGDKFGPDLLQTMSVGARAVGMGGAYTTLADDASATFWNPARLHVIKRNQLVFEMRSMVQDHLVIRGTEGPNGTLGTITGRYSANTQDPQISFAGIAVPLMFKTKRYEVGDTGQREAKDITMNLGVLGFSYSLGGYANLLDDSDTFVPFAGGSPVETLRRVQTVVRNSYVTVAYGRQDTIGGGRFVLGSGAGFYVVNQNQNQVDNTTIIDPNNIDPGTGQPTRIHLDSGYRDVGTGNGFILGFTVRPQLPSKESAPAAPGQKPKTAWVPGPWLAGFTYRSGPKLDGLGEFGTLFNTEMPERITAGVGYETRLSGGRGRPAGDLSLAADLQHFGSSSPDDRLDHRGDVTNFHLGAEFTPARARNDFRTPIRLGFRTISAANSRLFKDDSAVSFGGAFTSNYPNGNAHYSLEAAGEYMLTSGLFQYTVSGSFWF